LTTVTSSQLTPAKENLTSELNSRLSAELPLSQRGTPTWELALNFPHQGEWTEEEYLSLDSNRMIEFSDGMLEFLPMPKPSHARISRFISDVLRGYVTSKNIGDVFWAPFSIRISPTKLREPDIIYLSNERIPQNDVPPNGTDLVVEVVSESAENRFRDINVKRSEYAAAAIPEYWIVDPATESITVLSLSKGNYEVERVFRHGTIATSVLLPGFEVDVSAAFAAAKPTSN
jgi:Uma2 family endonuclease